MPHPSCGARRKDGMDDFNVLVIVSDTLRRDHVGAYGGQVQTPHLDRFAQEAIVFDSHIIGSFPTMPARADYLTGLLSLTFMGWEPLPAHLPTLPAALSEAGYTTVGVVDTPFFVRDGWGYDRGFDDFYWIRGQGEDTRPLERSDSRRLWLSEADRFAARTMTEASLWLDRNYREKFFLYVDTWDPHEPWDAPDYYTSLYLPDYDGAELFPAYRKVSEAGLTEHELQLARALYAGEVTMVDRWIGFLLDKVRVLGIADRTIVIVLSDHGFYFGEHDFLGKADWFDAGATQLAEDAQAPAWLAESWLFTLLRSPLYQELTRVPLIVRVPGLSPGRRSALTTAIDLPATILDLAGVAEQEMHGLSFKNVLVGEDKHRDFVVSSWPLYFAQGEYTSAVDGKRRAVSTYMPITVTTRTRSLLIGGPDDAPELYDLEADPTETTNIWDQRRPEDEQLFNDAIDYLEQCGTADASLTPRRRPLPTHS
jgi:arylsulfatase A-like enzyme